MLRHEFRTHIRPEINKVVTDDLFLWKVDVFHWKTESPSCLCWSQRGSDEAEVVTILNRLMNVNPVPIAYIRVSTRSRDE